MPEASKVEKKMQIAGDFSLLATCPKKSVGVYIEDKYGKSVSMGYNGAPAGFVHCDLAGCQEIDSHCTNAVHSEMNGILNGDVERMRDGTMFLYGAFPCYRCAQAIVTVKIRYLYFSSSRKSVSQLGWHADLTNDQKRGYEILNQGSTIINRV